MPMSKVFGFLPIAHKRHSTSFTTCIVVSPSGGELDIVTVNLPFASFSTFSTYSKTLLDYSNHGL